MHFSFYCVVPNSESQGVKLCKKKKGTKCTQKKQKIKTKYMKF